MLLPTRKPEEKDFIAWAAKHGVEVDESGYAKFLPEGRAPVTPEKLLENIATNLQVAGIENLEVWSHRKSAAVYVGGGPSAQDFVEEIRGKANDSRFDMFCSNMTAKWLLDNGIIPKYQIIIDPQPSKVLDVAHRNADITYLVGVECDPSVLLMLAGLKIKRFLAASSKEDYQEAGKYANNLVAIGGGTMTGTRMLMLANVMGYRRLEYYGFDGSVRMIDGSVEMYSYDKPRTETVTEVECSDGRKFFSTPTFSRQAVELEMFRHRMPWIDLVIHGDGFLAHYLNLSRANETNGYAHYRISPDYLDLQKRMFEISPQYATSGHQHAGSIYIAMSQIAKKHGTCSVLDYGCGRETLRKVIETQFSDIAGAKFSGYDPSIDGLDAEPEAADLVVCTDVMEHIEPECVNAVVEHIEQLTKKAAYISIATVPARKVLPDGRNAHICLESDEWWEGKIRKHFVVLEKRRGAGTITFICQKLPKQEDFAWKMNSGSD